MTLNEKAYRFTENRAGGDENPIRKSDLEVVSILSEQFFRITYNLRNKWSTLFLEIERFLKSGQTFDTVVSFEFLP